MTGLQTRSLALVSLVAFALPIGGALAAGARAGAGSAIGGGTGAAGMGSAAVGGGAPSGRVGGGPPAGPVGGGAPGSNSPASNGAAGTGYPSSNAQGMQIISPDNPAAGPENAQTTGGVNGGMTGTPPKPDLGGARPPPVIGQEQPSDAAR